MCQQHHAGSHRRGGRCPRAGAAEARAQRGLGGGEAESRRDQEEGSSCVQSRQPSNIVHIYK